MEEESKHRTAQERRLTLLLWGYFHVLHPLSSMEHIPI